MSETDRIWDQLQRTFEGGDAWRCPSLRDLLATVSAPHAAARPIPGAPTIWELLLHLTVYENVARRRLGGEKVETLPDELGWPKPTDTSAAAWLEAKLDFGEARGDRAEAVRPRDPARTGLDDAEAARGQEREPDHDLHPAVGEAEAVPVARVGDRLRHLALADVEGTARHREAGGLEGVAAVQACERGLDDLLRQAKEEEEAEERGHAEGIIRRLSSRGTPMGRVPRNPQSQRRRDCGSLVARHERSSSG